MAYNFSSPFHLKSVTVSVGRQSPTKFDQFQVKSPAALCNLPPVTSRNRYDIHMKPSVRLRNHSLMSNILGLQESIELDKKHKFSATNEEANKLKVLKNEHRINKNPKIISKSVKINNPILERRTFEKINENFEQSSNEISTPHNYLGIIKSRFTQESEQSEQDNMRKLSEQLTKIKKYTLSQDLLTINNIYKPKRFKSISIFVRAAMRFSQKYRKIQKKQYKEYQKLLLLKKPHQSYIDSFDQAQIQKQHKKFVEAVTMKMIVQLQQKEYITECELIWQKIGDFEKDIRRTRFCVLSYMLLQNLEFLTRKDNLPWLIKHQLNLSLFQSKERQVSQYLADRSHLYSQSNLTISQECKLLIASEYFFFDFLSPNLVILFNDVKTQSEFHKNQTLYYCVSMFNLLQTLFTKYFKKISRHQAEKRSLTPIQRKLIITSDSKTNQFTICLNSVTKLEDDETQLIFGEFQANQMQAILKERRKWGQKVYKLFSQVCLNLQLQLII